MLPLNCIDTHFWLQENALFQINVSPISHETWKFPVLQNNSSALSWLAAETVENNAVKRQCRMILIPFFIVFCLCSLLLSLHCDYKNAHSLKMVKI